MNGKTLTTLPKTIMERVSSTRAKTTTTIKTTRTTAKTEPPTTTTTTISEAKAEIIIPTSQSGFTTKQTLKKTEKRGVDGSLSMRLFTLIGLPFAILLSLFSFFFWLRKIYRKTNRLSTPETTNPIEIKENQHHYAVQD
ncbi:uncharacterized protein LOC130648724 [Hydractinia symbiolongicarpus]|uniref:uncharacterized protein LOC130648724 n=1 Tax=Hydractinia symbiolongicarpus TaxID=13093 RepID=UPI00254BD0FE|nr:uncharacterized protein LOC130648724 [Hydractinia symbiolongicarpus]